jgi:myosin-7
MFSQQNIFLNLKITKSEAIQMAALIYRARYGMDKSKFQTQQGLLNLLIPDDLVPEKLKIDDWKKQIINAYSKRMELTESECKLEFLRLLEKQETFGSTFFVVNQRTVSYYPSPLLIAINRLGFHIIDPVKKVKINY